MSFVAQAIGRAGFGTYEVEWDASGATLSPSNRPAEGLVLPGFVDLHFHGAFGIDLMAAQASDVVSLCEKMIEQGYEGLLATTVTAPLPEIHRFFSNLPENPMILGVHLEGPFISSVFPGAQPQTAILPIPLGGQWDPILSDPRLKLITLAPELDGAPELIRTLTSRGVRVGMGHTDATFDQARVGFEAGARQTTHTFNAMRGLHHRESGTVGFALLEDSLDTELIYDRLHVCREAAEILVRMKGSERILAVSDSTMASGMPAGKEFDMWGLRCITGPGEVRLADSGALAGSAITLLDAFRNLIEDFGPELAIRACSLNPRRVLRMEGTPKVWLRFDQQLELIERVSTPTR